MIIFIYLLAEKINLKLFAWVGGISYELYLVHGYILPYVQGIIGAVLFWILSFGIGGVYHCLLKKLLCRIKETWKIETTR
jgi:peptidoglycan/LPS O-acetylase OafA/YrhL